MMRETRELLVAMRRLNLAIPQAALEIADESLAVQQQVEFGGLLIGLGQRVQLHAQQRVGLVIDADDGQTTVE